MNGAGRSIIDGHCHLASTRSIPLRFIEDVGCVMHGHLTATGQRLPRARLIDLLVQQHQDHLGDELIRQMDEAGIARAVLLAPDFSQVMAGAPGPRTMAEHHHEVRLRHPGRFHVFIGLDPRTPDGVAEFESLLDTYGFEGVKLYPPCGYSSSDPGLYPYYEICAARGLPVVVHTGPTSQSLNFRIARPLEIDQAARDFPRVNFILAHGAVTHVDECAYLAAYRENVYLDTGGFTAGSSPDGWPAHLARVFAMRLCHKIVFGIDWPISKMSGGLPKVMAEIFDGGLVLRDRSPVERALLFGGNMERLLPSAAA